MRGEDLRRLRLRAGLTQEELARRSGVASASVSRIERGLQVPNKRTRDALADALALPERPALSRMAALDLRRFVHEGRLGKAGRQFLELLLEWFFWGK